MLIKVKVRTKQKEKKIIKKSEDSFEVWVKESPLNNQANLAVFEVLSDYFNLPLNKIRLVKGSRQPNKIFEIKL